jgi:formylmethanofuran dehydrogenase subunit C
VSEAITLTLRASLDAPVSMHAVQPQKLAGLSEQQISAIVVTTGRSQVALGDLFSVQGSHSSRLRIAGSTRLLEGLGSGMLDGELIIDGNAGTDVGAAMTGGTIHARGSVGDGAGVGMGGGVLRIDGDAGDRLGAGLPGASRGITGGEIIVSGSTGSETGARARRGLIVVAGNAGRDAGRAMIAGSIVVLGGCGEGPGRGNKRGSIVSCGAISIPATYRYACTFSPPHLRLTFRYLTRRYGLQIAASVLEGRYRRYCGDAGDPGKGEILELVRSV